MKIKVYDTDAVTKSFGETSDAGQMSLRALEVQKLLFLPKGLSEEDQQAALQSAIDELIEIAPENGLERMLAVQMVGAHHAILECLRRAQFENQSFEGREMNLKHAQKMMDIYLKQIAALDKHRGKGQQKMVVEHISIAPGGQANVGQVKLAQQQNNVAVDEAPDKIIDLKPDIDSDWLD